MSHWSAYHCKSFTSFAQHDPATGSRCPNSYITTHILEGAVIGMIREIMLDPAKLALHTEGGDHLPDTITAHQLARTARRFTLLEWGMTGRNAVRMAPDVSFGFLCANGLTADKVRVTPDPPSLSIYFGSHSFRQNFFASLPSTNSNPKPASVCRPPTKYRRRVLSPSFRVEAGCPIILVTSEGVAPNLIESHPRVYLSALSRVDSPINRLSVYHGKENYHSNYGYRKPSLPISFHTSLIRRLRRKPAARQSG